MIVRIEGLFKNQYLLVMMATSHYPMDEKSRAKSVAELESSKSIAIIVMALAVSVVEGTFSACEIVY